MLFKPIQKSNSFTDKAVVADEDQAVLAECLARIEQKLARGNSQRWTTQDFEQLSEHIRLETGVLLSVTTLKRLWGKVRYESAPTASTLNALARFLGYANWSICKQAFQPVIVPAQSVPAVHHSARPTQRAYSVRWGLIGLLAGASLLVVVLVQPVVPTRLQPRNFSFHSRRVAVGLPTTVIFSYDASKAPTDSVFIQQSWDERRRARIDKHRSAYTSIYYEPGYYRAKLVVGDQIVQEQPLLIPSSGWLATIATASVPVYLSPSSFVKPDGLVLPVDTLLAHGIAVQPQPPLTKFFNVGNFEPVALVHFSFSSKVKATTRSGAGPCQFCWVILVTDGASVTIPLGQPGCVSELSLLDGQQVVSGKTTDLSGFGVDVSHWVQVDCQSEGQMVNYFVNGRLVHRTNLPPVIPKVVGLIYVFQGTGSVKDIKLVGNHKTVLAEF